jgi:nitrate/nitrite transporter NarK
MFRFFGMLANDYYLPSFFLKNYSNFSVEYSYCATLITVFCGMFSATSGGILADKFSQKNPIAYARIS